MASSTSNTYNKYNKKCLKPLHMNLQNVIDRKVKRYSTFMNLRVKYCKYVNFSQNIPYVKCHHRFQQYFWVHLCRCACNTKGHTHPW